MAHSILRVKSVTETVGLSRSTLYRLVKAGLFPKPVQLGLSAIGWRSEEIQAWLASRETVGAGA